MKKTLTAAICATLLVTALAGATAEPSSSAAVLGVGAVVVEPEPSCDTHCREDQCGLGEHRAVGTDRKDEQNATRGDGWHDKCDAGTCSDNHGPICGAGGIQLAGAEFEELRRFLADNDATKAAAIVAKNRGSVEVNRARSAIQVLDCQGNLWAHLHATPELIGVVSSVTAHANPKLRRCRSGGCAEKA